MGQGWTISSGAGRFGQGWMNFFLSSIHIFDLSAIFLPQKLCSGQAPLVLGQLRCLEWIQSRNDFMLFWNEFIPKNSMFSYHCINSKILLPENSIGRFYFILFLSPDCLKIIPSACPDYLRKYQEIIPKIYNEIIPKIPWIDFLTIKTYKQLSNINKNLGKSIMLKIPNILQLLSPAIIIKLGNEGCSKLKLPRDIKRRKFNLPVWIHSKKCWQNQIFSEIFFKTGPISLEHQLFKLYMTRTHLDILKWS